MTPRFKRKAEERDRQRALFLFRDWPFLCIFVIGGGREKIFGEGACSSGLNQGVWIAAADLISALATGTHWDITATDQIRPIATTTAIPIPLRICIPSASRVELGEIWLAYFSAPPCEAVHS